MKKRLLSFLLALVMVLSLMPMTVFATEGNVAMIDSTEYATLADALKAAGSRETIVLLANVNEATPYNFGSKYLTLDLAGFTLSGVATNATHTTVVNSNEEHQKTLAAVGEYANDVSEFVDDDEYKVKDDNKCVVYYAKYFQVDSTKCESFTEALTAISEASVKKITLLQDATIGTVDFNSAELTIDLAGFNLVGSAENAANVTIANTGTTQTTLGVTGTFENDCSGFIADGYDLKIGDNKTVIKTQDDDYSIKVVTSTAKDRDDLTEATAKTVDIYAGDIVDVEVRVYGYRYAANDITLTYDKDLFNLITNTQSIGWEGDYESEFMVEDGEEITGAVRSYAATGAGQYFEPDELDDMGTDDPNDDTMYYVIGKLQFEAKASSVAVNKVAFKVKQETEGVGGNAPAPAGAYITKAKLDGTTVAAQKINDSKITNGYVNIKLRQMAVTVIPKENLTYKNLDYKLVENGFTAKDNLDQVNVSGATIKYAMLDADVANGIQKTDSTTGDAIYTDAKTGLETTTASYDNEPIMIDETTPKTDESGRPLYKSYKNDTETIEAKTYNAPVYTTAPQTPADDAYGTAIPTAKNAGDYVVFYKVSKNGYDDFYGQVEVSIGKRVVPLTWNHDETDGGSAEYNLALGTKSGCESQGTTTFYANYRGGGYLNSTGGSPIYATYSSTENVDKRATVTMKSFKGETPADGTKLEEVGMYVYEAYIDENHLIKVGNETYERYEIKVLIDGDTINGYSMATSDEGNTVISTVPTKELWFDGQNHTPAFLDKAEDATEGTEDEPLTIKYLITDDFGDNWTEYDAIPDFKDPGTYTVKAKLTMPHHYDLELTPVTFVIKEVVFKAEKFKWVTGYDIVLVYTNSANVGFTYDGAFMYDMSSLGYKYGNTVNEDKTVGTEIFKYVYGLVVFGEGDTQLVVPSNEYEKTKSINNIKDDGSYDSRYDVNHTNTGDINDYVAVQSVYNVDPLYLNDEANMSVVLKADTSGDKKVNTIDCSIIKANEFH